MTKDGWQESRGGLQDLSRHCWDLIGGSNGLETNIIEEIIEPTTPLTTSSVTNLLLKQECAGLHLCICLENYQLQNYTNWCRCDTSTSRRLEPNNRNPNIKHDNQKSINMGNDIDWIINGSQKHIYKQAANLWVVMHEILSKWWMTGGLLWHLDVCGRDDEDTPNPSKSHVR